MQKNVSVTEPAFISLTARKLTWDRITGGLTSGKELGTADVLLNRTFMDRIRGEPVFISSKGSPDREGWWIIDRERKIMRQADPSDAGVPWDSKLYVYWTVQSAASAGRPIVLHVSEISKSISLNGTYDKLFTARAVQVASHAGVPRR